MGGFVGKISNGKACPLCWIQSYEPINEHSCPFDIQYVISSHYRLNRLEVEKLMSVLVDQEIKLDGSEQNMLRARFRQIFKSGAGHLTIKIKKITAGCPNCTDELHICKEHIGLVIPMIDQWIVKLTEASFTPKVLAQSARVFRDDITKNLSEKEANFWKAKSREYVVKEPVDNKEKTVKPKKESKGIDPIALIAALKEQGLTKEQIMTKLGLK